MRLEETLTKIRIIGFGQVTRSFLKMAESLFPSLNVDIYCEKVASKKSLNKKHRLIPVELYNESSHPTFLACSTNESKIIEQTGGRNDRLLLLDENLKIIDQLAESNKFFNGPIYVLTNPCELIAESLRSLTKNPDIYALGLSVDQRRYQTVISRVLDKEISTPILLGNHYHFPLPEITGELERLLCEKLEVGRDHLYSVLKDLLTDLISSEFEGSSPPSTSGAQAICDTIVSIKTSGLLNASGFSRKYGSYTGGLIDFKKATFRSSLPASKSSLKVFHSVIAEHRERAAEINSTVLKVQEYQK